MGKKLGRKIAAFLVVVTPLQLWMFSHYNNILKEPSAASVQAAEKPQPSTSKIQDAKQELAALAKQYPTAALSGDNQLIAYVDDTQTLHLKNLTNGSTSTLTQFKAPVVYLHWIGNDRMFVGEKYMVSGVHHLTLATVDVQSPEPRIIKSFSGLSSTTTFKKIAFSPYTNDVYVLLGNAHSGTIYHFDTNGAMTVMYLGGRMIQDVDVGETNGDLFFQDYAEGTKNVLLYQNHATSLIQRNSVILGVVNNDLFYGTLNSDGLVTQVYDYPTAESAAQNQTANTTGAQDTQSGPPALVKTLDTPVDAGRISITDQKQVVITPQ